MRPSTRRTCSDARPERLYRAIAVIASQGRSEQRACRMAGVAVA